jgi:hypothetical protein
VGRTRVACSHQRRAAGVSAAASGARVEPLRRASCNRGVTRVGRRHRRGRRSGEGAQGAACVRGRQRATLPHAGRRVTQGLHF